FSSLSMNVRSSLPLVDSLTRQDLTIRRVPARHRTALREPSTEHVVRAGSPEVRSVLDLNDDLPELDVRLQVSMCLDDVREVESPVDDRGQRPVSQARLDEGPGASEASRVAGDQVDGEAADVQ